MSDETPASGNRWEPTLDGGPEAPDTTPEPSRPSAWSRARSALAAGAVAVLVAVGLGGFAVGRATAESGGGGSVDQQGRLTGFAPDGDGFRGPGPGGQLPGGQPPGVPGGSDTGGDGSPT